MLLLFVCTHNARRSQLAQAWGSLIFAGVPALHCASGGAERTRCHPSAVAALRRSGWTVVEKPLKTSPGATSQVEYTAVWPEPSVACDLSSKTVAEVQQPLNGASASPAPTVALLLCGDDPGSKCPRVPGAAGCFSWQYADPGKSDGALAEAATYDATSTAIREGLVELHANVMSRWQPAV